MIIKNPGLAQGILLLTASSLTTMMTALLGPTLPPMQAHFASAPSAQYLVPLTVTAPMLTMALLSIFAGAAVDQIGRKQLLLAGSALYAIFGVLPFWLDSLQAILLSRIVLGLADAAVMTSSLTLISDYWEGSTRDKYLALQTTAGSASAVLFGILGGYLGELGWRAPYAIYAAAVVFVPAIAMLVWEPGATPPASLSSTVAVPHSDPSRFRPLLLAAICALAVLGGVAFLTVPIHLAFLMDGLGVRSSAIIGNAQALNSLGVVCGTLLFGWLVGPRLRTGAQLLLCMSIAAAGFLGMASAGNTVTLVAASVLNGLGCGLLLPTLVTWNMRELPFERRGMGAGAFTSALFLGMFVNPVVIVFVANVAGGRPVAIGLLGVLLLLMALIVWIAFRLRPAELALQPASVDRNNQCIVNPQGLQDLVPSLNIVSRGGTGTNIAVRGLVTHTTAPQGGP